MGKFVIKTSEKGCHFVLKADNGEVIATSQHYKSKDSCKKGIESVKKNAPTAEIVEEEAQDRPSTPPMREGRSIRAAFLLNGVDGGVARGA